MIVNEKIFTLLKERGISQKSLSQMTGIPESTISDWKRKGKTPGADKIVEVCKALEINPSELLEISEKKTSVSSSYSEYSDLIEKFRKLDLGKQQKLVRYLDLLLLENGEY
ncbi:helix-turn-helix domain-containing protein [Pseudobutyrivibrio sp. ACV-2]|uniref:helix-turn-helix domain-containing protein n=1 Tax=Pseudobutyrivibrio sp. ACV-2 TaxID=1520801 RepID=UPI000B7F1B0D|nr:helix-turn-helix transcriptional regulator [Pseudobutyrivibrio sp. ACV-2]